jgi:hypothetical protein
MSLRLTALLPGGGGEGGGGCNPIQQIIAWTKLQLPHGKKKISHPNSYITGEGNCLKRFYCIFTYFDSSMTLFSAIYFCQINKNRTANIAHF